MSNWQRPEKQCFFKKPRFSGLCYPFDVTFRADSSILSEALRLLTCQIFLDSASKKLMNADQLRSMQAPLKAKYREEPKAALITLRAQGRIGEGITCRVETGKALVEAGLHPATGGDGLAACSGDMLLEALAACAGVTLCAVATAIGVELHDGAVTAEGDLDFRGTLGVSKEAPVGFRAIRLHFDLETNADADQLATLIRLTERYCVVYQTLRQPPEITVAHSVEGIVERE